MGTTTKDIKFFSDQIVIRPHTVGSGHTATRALDLNDTLDKPITIARFASGQPVSLQEVLETHELIVKREDGAMIQGPEVTVSIYKCVGCFNDFAHLGTDSLCHHCLSKMDQFPSVYG